MERASLPGSCDFPPNDHSPPARSLSPPVTPGTYSPTAQDETPGSTPLQPRPALFINRMLKTRSKASEPISPSYRHSLDYPESRTATLDSYDHTDETRLLADAERMALRYAEESARRSQQGVSKGVPEDEDSEDEPDSPTSEYSQLSAPHDHSALLSTEPPTRHQSSRSLGRRKSSRRRARTPVLPAELPPVAEVPDTPRHLSLSASRPTSTIAHSSVEVALSHGRPSRPTSLALDQPVSFPLLTSTAFGKSNSASATSSGSTSSNFGWGSNSSGRASRYPSLAPSSIGPSSGSHPHSEGGTDWHHLPAGLAAIKNLRVEPLQNPHSPVEPPSDIPSSSNRPADLDAPKSNKRAHLREGTASSMPEVERRTVTPGGIASIDISL